MRNNSQVWQFLPNWRLGNLILAVARKMIGEGVKNDWGGGCCIKSFNNCSVNSLGHFINSFSHFINSFSLFSNTFQKEIHGKLLFRLFPCFSGGLGLRTKGTENARLDPSGHGESS